MAITVASAKLTHAGALQALSAAVAKSEQIGAPQNISIVDEGGNLLAFVRTDGAKLLSRETSLSKAVTAASHRQPTGRFSPEMEPRLASASAGRLTNLAGGLPILIDGEYVGGIGVGSGTPEQDVEVAKAALRAIGADIPT